jgi:hypothetical protein
MVKLIESVSQGIPSALSEIIKLGRTLKKRATEVLAYFEHLGTSNGPTEAINGRLEHLRVSASKRDDHAAATGGLPTLPARLVRTLPHRTQDLRPPAARRDHSGCSAPADQGLPPCPRRHIDSAGFTGNRRTSTSSARQLSMDLAAKRTAAARCAW